MIDPRTQYILHQERQNELMAQIERKLAAQEMDYVGQAGAAGQSGSETTFHQPWYSVAQRWFRQWLGEKGIHRGFAAGQTIKVEK